MYLGKQEDEETDDGGGGRGVGVRAVAADVREVAAGFFSVGVKETPDVQPSDRGIVVPGPVKIVPVR